MIQDHIFHVHTYRCGHAEEVPDEAYINKSIEKGAKKITFTDHAPFPGDPFGNRMRFSELSEYISTLKSLKNAYREQIEVCIGLEIEYLPSYLSYYEKLRGNEDIDVLMIGQHFYEVEPGIYSFSSTDKKKEYIGLCQAIVQGINTRLFDVVAHPDRSFRRCNLFGGNEKKSAQDIIEAAAACDVRLEQNFSSIRRKNQYREEFWKMLNKRSKTIYGYDAHWIKELDL